MIIVGIDTARGWAVAYHPDGADREILACGTVQGLEQMLLEIRTIHDEWIPDLIRVEKSPTKKAYKRMGVSHAVMENIAEKVGENRGHADAIFYFCKGLGVPVEFINPIRNGTKLSKNQIEKLTGYDGRSSEHSRDAIVISWCREKNKK